MPPDGGDELDAPSREATADVAIVAPILNEASTIERFAKSLRNLDPAPREIVIVDGGSDDGGDVRARELGFAVVRSPKRGRPAQINLGVASVAAANVCVVHADTELPFDALAVVERALGDDRVSLAGFTPIISGPDTVRWMTTFHNWLKTWYVPLLFRPLLFFQGGRLLFGDHAMFFRRADFDAVGGFDPAVTVMEEADLCLKMARRGRIRLVNRIVVTSDRRIAEWGEWRANWIYVKVGLMWAFRSRRNLERHYPDVR